MDWTLVATTLFWVSLGLVIYTYLGYPVVLTVLASSSQVWQDVRFALRRRDRRQRPWPRTLPSVSLIFSAYNEEEVIAAKMRNCSELDYPANRLEILVGCDGCSDRTAELAGEADLPNARIFNFPQRSGKPAVLNRLIPEANGRIVVFSDANTMLDPKALRLLVRHFRNTQVGCVCGELRLTARQDGPEAESSYWRYEAFLKFLENRLGAVLGANGAIFAVRRNLFSPLPVQAIVDDFIVAMRIRAQGRRVVYDPEAIGYEEAAASLEQEFQRRVRIGAGNFHALRLTWRLLLPTAGLVALSYWSHKVLRWIVPWLLAIALVSALSVTSQPFYAAATLAGVVTVALALVGRYMERRNLHYSVFSIPYYFHSMNLALLLGFLRFLSGSQTLIWNRTSRGLAHTGDGTAP